MSSIIGPFVSKDCGFRVEITSMFSFILVYMQRSPELQFNNPFLFCSSFSRNNKNPVCQKCKEEDPSTLSEGSLLAEERVSCGSQFSHVSLAVLWSALQSSLLLLCGFSRQITALFCVLSTHTGLTPSSASSFLSDYMQEHQDIHVLCTFVRQEWNPIVSWQRGRRQNIEYGCTKVMNLQLTLKISEKKNP